MAFLLVPFLFLDVCFEASASRECSAGVLVVGLGLGALASRGTARLRRAVLLLAFAGSVFGISAIPWTTRKPFLRDLYSLSTGMTVAEVDAVMGGYIRGTGWPSNPLVPGNDGGLTAAPIIDAQAGSIGTALNGDGGQLEI